MQPKLNRIDAFAWQLIVLAGKLDVGWILCSGG